MKNAEAQEMKNAEAQDMKIAEAQEMKIAEAQDIKNAESILLFKSKIKKWHGEECSCKLCRPFIPNLGFL